MKRLELALTVVQLPLDYCLLILAGLTAYSLRFATLITSIRPVIFALSWAKFFPALVFVAGCWIFIFACSGLYRVNPNRKLAQDLATIIMACSTGFAAITIYIFFALQKFDSRFLVLASWILAIVYVSLGRLIMRGLRRLLYRSGIGRRSTVIIGAGANAEAIATTLKQHPEFGYAVTAAYTTFNAEVARAINPGTTDEIIFTSPKANSKEVLKVIDFANEHHITFKYSADLFDTAAANMTVSTIAGIPIVELGRTRLFGWGRIIKRMIDFLGALILLIITSPLFLVISIIILIETGRPVIYKNERVGQFGKKFIVYKFRSMYQNQSTGEQFGDSGKKALEAEAALIKKQNGKTGPIYKIVNDPRITPFGHFIRRWSLDELPQFFNVLKGNMSLVGPRPHQPREVAGYEPEHSVLFAIKPGITGLAQISGRSDLTFDDEARLDTFYVEKWSLVTDAIVLVKTPFVVLKKTGAR